MTRFSIILVSSISPTPDSYTPFLIPIAASVDASGSPPNRRSTPTKTLALKNSALSSVFGTIETMLFGKNPLVRFALILSCYEASGASETKIPAGRG